MPNSANAGTAYLCGVKANFGTIGVDGRVQYENCSSSLDPSTHVSSILQWAQEQGKWTGFVTTDIVTGSTPAGLYAHTAASYWEASTPDPNCLDIAQQLTHGEPGKNIRVIMGGGRGDFIPANKFDIDGNPGHRKDSKNLLEEWEELRKKEDAAYKIIHDAKELRETQPDQVDYLLGLFHSDSMPYVTDRPDLSKEYPTLTEMSEMAIKVLNRSPNGFFLLVEGARIDDAHHENWAMKALEEGVEFDEAIQKAQEMVDEKNTLLVVTADHSHSFTVGGNYPLRGTNILGIGGVSNVDHKTLTILGYHNGPGYKSNSRDRNLTNEEALNKEFRIDALLPMRSGTHGAEDVAVYAMGPMAHLFHGVHELSYIAYAIAYAACIGDNRQHCNGAWPTLGNDGAFTILKFLCVTYGTYIIGNHML